MPYNASYVSYDLENLPCGFLSVLQPSPSAPPSPSQAWVKTKVWVKCNEQSAKYRTIHEIIILEQWQSYSYYVVLVQRLTSHDRHTLTNITSKSYLLAFALPFFPLQVSPVGSSPLNGIADHWTFLTLWISFGACLFCIFDFFLNFCVFSHSWISCITHLSQPVWPLPKVWLTLDWERSPR